MRRFVALVVFLTVSLVPLPTTAAPAGGSATFPARIDLANGFFPAGIESGPGTT